MCSQSVGVNLRIQGTQIKSLVGFSDVEEQDELSYEYYEEEDDQEEEQEEDEDDKGNGQETVENDEDQEDEI
ncbi:MAG: hypothetical protein EZS28_040481 [Streblomastix strix]|uniref:Uncharacterized protein n=1 Tax=Streblomastix strix TaxID=222440 RepID=A0A5J4U1U9_9EUKA|nr:MAG: hypothetical protein EZS28_040481 [Streblomastix strix]